MIPGLTKRRATDAIVVHCSASVPSADTDVKTIDRWHRQRGFSMVGYHYVIKTDGEIQEGRPLDYVGAHVQGFNSRTVGICLIGGVDAKNKPSDNFTSHQKFSLLTLLKDLSDRFPGAEILGHRDFPGVNKACPSFDVRSWLTEVSFYTQRT